LAFSLPARSIRESLDFNFILGPFTVFFVYSRVMFSIAWDLLEKLLAYVVAIVLF